MSEMLKVNTTLTTLGLSSKEKCGKKKRKEKKDE